MKKNGLCSTSDVITSKIGIIIVKFCRRGDLSDNTQIRVISSFKLEIYRKMLKNLSEKLRRNFPSTTLVVLMPWQFSRVQSLSVKNQISPFAPAQNRHASYVASTLLIRLLGVDYT